MNCTTLLVLRVLAIKQGIMIIRRLARHVYSTSRNKSSP